MAAAGAVLRPVVAGAARRLTVRAAVGGVVAWCGAGPGAPAEVALLASGAVRVPCGVLVEDGPVAALRPGDDVWLGGGRIVVAGVPHQVVRFWDDVVPHLTDGRASALREVLAAAGVRRECVVDSRAAPSTLLGLGPGLTPAGDDVLAGMLLAAAALGEPVPAWYPALPPLDSTTTAVSAALLRLAAAGRATPPVLRLLATPSAAALAPVLALGHTSGTALAAGLARGLTGCAYGRAA